MKTKHAPEQQVDPNNSASTDHTTWDYNADDTVQKITDARGAISTFSYNNSHLVTGITFSAVVNYVHDKSGQVTSVTGTGFPNVSTYASDLQYRASGALKHLTYGNNRTLDIGYNAELQPSSYQIPNLINKAYQYSADGTLKYSQDLLDAKFDRSYGYDHAGRMRISMPFQIQAPCCGSP